MKAKILAAWVVAFLIPIHAGGQTAITGEWRWQGTAGWQQFAMLLKADGKKLTGTLSMGPDSAKIGGPDDYWKYFFKPAVFQIANGKIDGNTISFQQVLSNTPAEILSYTGRIEGDRIDFVRESPHRPNDPFSLGGHKFEFTVTRAGTEPPNRTVLKPTQPASNPRVVPLDFEVTDSQGILVSGLLPDDFLVYEDGEPRPIQTFESMDEPSNYSLLFDHNLTWLKDDPKRGSPGYVVNYWSTLFNAVTRFVDSLRDSDRISVAAFEDKFQVVLDWRNAQSSVLRSIALPVAEQPLAQKDLFAAIERVARQSDGLKGRKVAVVFTDGRDGRLAPKWFRDPSGNEVLDPLFGLEDAGEAREFQNTLDVLRRSGVRTHFIVVNSDRDPEFGPAVVGRRISGIYPGSSDEIANYLSRVRWRMEQLAELTGGYLLLGNTPDHAISLYTGLTKALGVGRTYSIGFVSTRLADGAFHHVEVRPRSQDLRVRLTRDGYYSR